MGNVLAQSEHDDIKRRRSIGWEEDPGWSPGSTDISSEWRKEPEEETSKRSMFTEYTFIKNFSVSYFSSVSTLKRVCICTDKEITKCKNNNLRKTQLEWARIISS